MAPPYSVPAEDKGFHSLAFLGEEVPDAPTINGVITSASAMLTPNGGIGLDKVRDVLNLARELGQTPPDVQEPKSLVDFSFLHEAWRALESGSPGATLLKGPTR